MLISDLYEGGVRDEMLRRVAAMIAAGVQVVVLLALSDEGAPAYDHDNAAALAGARRAGVRLHAGRLPRPDGGRHRAPRPARRDRAPQAVLIAARADLPAVRPTSPIMKLTS